MMAGAMVGVFAQTPTSPSAPTLDKHGTVCYQPTSTFSLPISTSSPNALVVLIVQLNTVSPTNISDTSGLTWNGPSSNFQANGQVSLYWAVKPSSGSTIVKGVMPDSEHFKVLWFDVLGANLTNPFDPNPSLPANSGPETGPTMSVTASTSISNDFIFSYVTQVGGAVSTNTPTANSPFAILDGNNNGCYSQAAWLAYSLVSTTQSNVVFTPLTFTLSNQVAGFVAAIQGAGGSITTTSSSSSSSSAQGNTTTVTSTTTVTVTTTTTVTTSTSIQNSTTVISTCTITFTMSGQKVVSWQGSC